MGNEKLLKALGRLTVETGSLACLGCGWEHDCGVHGCAILRGVKAELEEETARAEEAEAALAAAVQDMEAMWLERGHGVRKPGPDSKRKSRFGRSGVNKYTGVRYVKARMFYSWTKMKALEHAIDAATEAMELFAEERGV